MPYKNKTYIGLDYDTDWRYYNTMKMWKQNDNIDFNFHNAHELTTIREWSGEDAIKRSLRERMQNSKIFMLLIGEKTKNCHTYVRWEIEQALKMNLPIIGINLNGTRKFDEIRCPAILRTELALHVPFRQAVITHAMDYWIEKHPIRKREGYKSQYYFNDNFYRDRGW